MTSNNPGSYQNTIPAGALSFDQDATNHASATYVSPNDASVIKHEDKSFLTLITCDTYNEKTGTYLRRVVVRAALVDVRLIIR